MLSPRAVALALLCLLPLPHPALAEEAAAPAAHHRAVLGFEVGWNGLSGVGVTGSWRPGPHLALDASAGLGALSPRGGVRLRYLGGDGGSPAFTAGVGLQVQLPFDGPVAEAPGPAVPVFYLVGMGGSTDVRLQTTALAQAVLGAQWRRPGLDVTLLAGWAQVVAGNRRSSAAPLNAEQRAWLRAMGGSGPVLAMTIAFPIW